MMKSLFAAGALLAAVGLGATANPSSARAAEFGVTVAGNNGYVRVATRSGEEDLRRRRANRNVDQNRGARGGDANRGVRSGGNKRRAVIVDVAPRRVAPARRHANRHVNRRAFERRRAYAPVRRHYAAPRRYYAERPVVIVRPAPIYRRVAPVPSYRNACLDRYEIRVSLEDRGFFNIRDFHRHEGDTIVTASNRYGTYRIRLDDCTGEVLSRRTIASLY